MKHLYDKDGTRSGYMHQFIHLIFNNHNHVNDLLKVSAVTAASKHVQLRKPLSTNFSVFFLSVHSQCGTTENVSEGRDEKQGLRFRK